MKRSVFPAVLCSILLLMFYTASASAETSDIVLAIYKGDVSLVTKDYKTVEAFIGKVISPDHYLEIIVAQNSKVYLKQNKRLVMLEKAGRYPLSNLFSDNSSKLDSAIAFLKKITQPRIYTSKSMARSSEVHASLTEADYFERFWEQVVADPEQKNESVKAEDYLAAAAWFSQKGNRIRTAYLLERLNNLEDNNNEFYRQLRSESLRGIKLVEINEELDTTRNKLSAQNTTLHYRALLIGINRYQNPIWQNLKNPVSDVQGLRNILVSKYHFEDRNITVLENASYDDIISGFNELKQSVTDNTSLLIYYAGHGHYPKDEGEGYWIPTDAGTPDSLRLFLPTSIILGKIKALKTKHTLLIADSCFSGSLIRKHRSAESNSRFYLELSNKNSRQIITSGGLEPVSDLGAGKHSIFAGKLIDVLSRERQEPLSASELAFYLRKEVKDAWGDQTPEYGRLHVEGDNSGEFFFVQKRSEKVQKEITPMVSPPKPEIKRKSDSVVPDFSNLPQGFCILPKPFTDLRHCDFRGKRLRNVSLEGANLGDMDFRYAQLENVVLKNANLEDTDWRYSDLSGVVFSGAILTDTDWRYSKSKNSDYSKAHLQESDFRHAELENAKFENANMVQNDLSYSRLNNVSFNYADLTESDLSYASMNNVSFTGANLTDVQTNQGSSLEYQIENFAAGIEKRIEKWSSSAQTAEKSEPARTSMDNRGDRFLFIGVNPVRLTEISQPLRPVSIGLYLGDSTILGFDYAKAEKKGDTAGIDASVSIIRQGVFLRVFPGSSFNFLFSVYRLSWSAEASTLSSYTPASASLVSELSSGSGSATVEETDTVTIGTIGIGNQWLFDSGIIIGFDWVMAAAPITDSASSRSTSSSGSTSYLSAADKEIDNLEEDLFKEELFSARVINLSFSLGFAF